MARGKRHTGDQILKELKEVEGGAIIASVGQAHGICDQTIDVWRQKCAGVSKSELSDSSMTLRSTVD